MYFEYDNKKIFYEEIGEGNPVIMLHGNTASSKMFKPILSLYKKNFKTILIDFLGNGKSDRINIFPTDLWIWQSKQVVKLIKHLNYEKLSLVGTSGGAYVAINVALQIPDLIDKVVVDSFDGRTFRKDFKVDLILEREKSKKNFMSRFYYRWQQGENWETIVDLDTDCLLRLANREDLLFVESLKNIKVPILFTGSREDKMVRDNLEKEYFELSKIIKNSKVYIFENGRHPSILSNAKKSAKIIKKYLLI